MLLVRKKIKGIIPISVCTFHFFMNIFDVDFLYLSFFFLILSLWKMCCNLIAPLVLQIYSGTVPLNTSKMNFIIEIWIFLKTFIHRFFFIWSLIIKLLLVGSSININNFNINNNNRMELVPWDPLAHQIYRTLRIENLFENCVSCLCLFIHDNPIIITLMLKLFTVNWHAKQWSSPNRIKPNQTIWESLH